MRFADPYFFFLLLLLPLFFLSFFRKTPSLRFSSLKFLKLSRRDSGFNPQLYLLILRSLAFIILIIALARPQSGVHFRETTSDGVDIMLLVDTSRSMEAVDLKLEGKSVNRLVVIKKVVADFIERRPTDRLGLIVFGDQAFTQCPLTLDHTILTSLLKKTGIGMAGDGTAIGQAVGMGAKRMRDLKAKSKVMILLTDGSNNAGVIDPIKASEVAQSLGIKVYTIGVGTKGKPAPFYVDTPFGKQVIYQEVDIDEVTLKAIAEKTGGRYFRATDTKELEGIYNEIDKLETSEVKVKEYTEYNEKFPLVLLIGIILLMLETLLRYTLLRKLP